MDKKPFDKLKQRVHGAGSVRTRSGRVLKVNRSLGEKWTALKEAKSLRKANRLRGLPKSRLKRIAWQLDPRRQYKYWFSRDGGIMALKIVGIGVLFLFIFTLAVFAYYRKDLPDITLSGANLGGSIDYYDRTGKVLLWSDYNGIKRITTSSDNISPYLKEATVAVEDRDFYNHRGFDVKGIGRAAVNDVFHRGSTQGASTITQQLVKLNLDWTQQRTFTRKIKEVILAVELERSYTKDEILTGYLNTAPYGSIDYGVQVAAGDYFHKSPKDLTLPEAAMLAVMPKAPAIYSPYSPDFSQPDFIARYNYVLDSLVKVGKISQATADAAKKTNVLAEVQPQQNRYAGIQAPYFVLAAKNEISTKFASNGPGARKIGGWKVITTLDSNLQKIAEGVIASNRYNALSHGADEEALVAEDVKTGQMVALVGGVDFNNADHGQINYAQTNISPGSSFKPYDYTTLINNNTDVGAGSVLYDSQGPIPGYSCTNKAKPSFNGGNTGGNCLWDYDFRYPGPVTLRYALGGSRNVPAVKAMEEAVPNDTSDERVNSVNKVISTANQMMSAPDAYRCFNYGVDVNTAKKTDEAQCHGSAAIGDGAYLHLDQHVSGLTTLARLGDAIPSTYILKIYDSASSSKPFYQWTQPKGTQVVRQDAAYIVDNMASDPNASYLPSGYYKWHNYNGWHNAVKTGTTNNGFDGLMMGWNTQYAVGSWVGYHTRNKSLSGAMEYSTTPLTRGFMTQALDALHTKPVNWTEPSDIQHLPAYVIRSHVGIGSVEPSPGTDLFPSWYKPRAVSTQAVTIDKVSGKLATNCTPAAAKENLGGNAAPNTFSIDQFYPPGQTGGSAAASNTSASDDVHNCGDSPPTVTITASDCNVSCTISATPFAGTHPLNDSNYPQFPGTVTIAVNGSTICTSTNISDGQPVQCPYTATFDGQGTITATVTDSVLYQGSDSATANFTQNNPGPPPVTGPTGFTAKKTGSFLTFSWTAGSTPSYTVYKQVGSGGTPVGGTCTGTSNTSCISGYSPGTYYVQDSSGKQSNTVSI